MELVVLLRKKVKMTKTYLLSCMKKSEYVECETDEEAIELAKKMDEELQPSYGVDIIIDGEGLFATVDGDKVTYESYEDGEDPEDWQD